MKKNLLLILVAVCAMISTTAVAQYDDAHAYFPLDENTTNTKGTIQATAQGGITFASDDDRGDVAIFPGGAYDDANAGYLNVQTGIINHDAVTINLWFMWTDTVTNADGASNGWWQRIFGFGSTEDSQADPAVNHDVYFLTTQGAAAETMQWNIHKGNNDEWAGGADTTLVYPEKLEYDRWYMVTCIHDANGAKLYVDGSLVDEKSTDGLLPSDFSFDDTFFGRSNWPDVHFWGKMDDIAVFSKTLTEQEITDIYEGVGTSIDGQIVNSTDIYAHGNRLLVSLPGVPKNASVRVYNLTGAEVYAQSNLDKVTEINNLKAGVYIVSVVNNNQTTSKKVLIVE